MSDSVSVPTSSGGHDRTTGSLTVRFRGDSVFLADNLPVEIRDANDQLVEQSPGGVSRELPHGLYRVRATLPGGARHDELVEIGVEPVDLVLGPEPDPVGLPWATSKYLPVDAIGDDLFIDPLWHPWTSSDLWATSPGDEVLSEVELLEVRGCEAVRGERWVFRATAQPSETPQATFAMGRSRITVSLPVNPPGVFPLNACVAAAVHVRGRDKMVVNFARQRRVAATLQGVIEGKVLLSSDHLFTEAAGLLLRKYEDPVGAVLGGLTLYRIGRIGEHQPWVENLARDFRWLPDGRALLAAVLSRSEREDDRARGLTELLDVAGQRMMCTDGLALLLALLRRWPGDDRLGARQEALTKVASNIEGVDWDAVFLTSTRLRGA